MTGLRERRAARRNPLDDAPETGTDGVSTDITDPEVATRMPDPNDPKMKEALRARARRRSLMSGLLGTVMSSRTRTALGIDRVDRSG